MSSSKVVGSCTPVSCENILKCDRKDKHEGLERRRWLGEDNDDNNNGIDDTLDNIAGGGDITLTKIDKEKAKEGGYSTQVKIVKQNLLELGTLTEEQANEEGFTDETEAALELFQRSYKLQESESIQHDEIEFNRSEFKVTKQIDRATLLMMDEALINGWKYKKLCDHSWRDEKDFDDIARQHNADNATASVPNQSVENSTDENAQTIPKRTSFNFGDRHSNVQIIQKNLKERLGVLKDPNDGNETYSNTYGPRTQRDVAFFQKCYAAIKKPDNSEAPKNPEIPEKLKKEVHLFDRTAINVTGNLDYLTLLAMDEALINDWKYPLAHYSWRKLFVDEDNANRIKKIKDEEKFINMVTGTGTHKDNLFRHKDQDAIHHPIIQNNLNTIYGYKITDGQPSGFQIITETSANYGNKTRLYVYLFQKYYNNKEIPKGYRKDYKKRVEELRVDGIVDGKTLLAMDETLTEEWLYGDTIEPLLREKLCYNDEMTLNEDLIRGVLNEMDCRTAAANSALIKALVTHCKKFEIDTPLRLAHFLSQCAHESNDYKTTEESGAYSLDMARAIHPTKKAELEKLFKDDLEIEEGDKLATDEHHKKFFNLVYANKQSLGNGDEASGDGYRYRGRGYMQLTGRANYRKFLNYYNNGKADEDKIDIDSEDDLNRISASVDISVQVSAYYWKYIAPNLNNYAHLGKEEDHVLLIGAIINGIFWSDDECLPREPNHHDKRLAKFKLAIKYFDDKIEALLRTEPRRQPRPRHASVSATTVDQGDTNATDNNSSIL